MRLDAVWYVAAVPNTRLSFGALVRGGGLMRRVLVLTVVVATSVLFGAQSAHARKGISKARLASAMLALSDMPTGWATVSIDPSDVEPTNNGACNTPNSFARAKKLHSTASAYKAFAEDPQTGPAIAEVAFALPSVKAARKFMTHPDFSCGEFDVSESNGVTLHYFNMGDLSFPPVGDDSLSWRDPRTPKKGDATGTTLSQDLLPHAVARWSCSSRAPVCRQTPTSFRAS